MKYDILIDFVIPVFIICVATTLLILGIDGEVKSILTMAAAWSFHAAVANRRTPKG